MVIGFVCEGPTDFPILAAVVDAVLGDDWEPRHIQPERDQLTGVLSGQGGCGEVRRWCEGMRHRLKGYLDYSGIDLLIIHMDGDRCTANHAATCEDLCRTIKGWLGLSFRTDKVLIVIPSQASEAWLCGAHRAVTPAFEREPHPVLFLARAGLIEQRADGTPRKDYAAYEHLAKDLRQRALDLCPILPELGRFVTKMQAFQRCRGAGV